MFSLQVALKRLIVLSLAGMLITHPEAVSLAEMLGEAAARFLGDAE